MNKVGRTLIVAFDGTSNEYDETNTNVVKLCAVLKMDDRDRQMVYYQPGIGTYMEPGIHGAIHQWILKKLDLAAAWTLGSHVQKGYQFLMENHLPNDKICIFGFSRGAYTARALCGMLDSVGLLSRGNQEQIPFAYRMYKTESPLAASFKQTFCTPVDIHFVGVWDTVASIGMFVPKKMPLASYQTIRTFRHAISLDETRARFGVKLWKPSKEVTGQVEQMEHIKSANPRVKEMMPLASYKTIRTFRHAISLDETRARFGVKLWKPSKEVTGQVEEKEHKRSANPRVKEMWFAGGHCDVGGGNVKDVKPEALSNISLRWMLHEMQQANCGILFDDKGLNRAGIPLDCVRRTANPGRRARTISDDTIVDTGYIPDEIKTRNQIESWEELDSRDAKAEINLALKPLSFWWLVQWPVVQGKKEYVGLFRISRACFDAPLAPTCTGEKGLYLQTNEGEDARTFTTLFSSTWSLIQDIVSMQPFLIIGATMSQCTRVLPTWWLGRIKISISPLS
ncbi:hypothetical protein M408DRAFT_61645 [Serendipita vermifera MAFF 305830]|uniref:T6SS Phospholipase effector Tle1-like catalytic domain-containing protein n=1 Tax=Serendipita vermifera MAFF 305830 TaxID=933852 RepID=A0A0C2X5E4_SERVB|nr:hypothetical protein M408DRAFT_61645 [Serendipita vermifera MAFF 305830]